MSNETASLFDAEESTAPNPEAESEICLPALHPKQEAAFTTPATEVLYGGATRGGKSHFVRHALIMWCAHIPGLQCDIFRLNFDDVISNHMQGDTGFPTLLEPWVKSKHVTITQTEVRFNWNGSLIQLNHCNDERAMLKHQGVAKHVRVFEEATQIRERYIRWLRSWVTMSEGMRAKVPKMFHVEHNGEMTIPFPRIIFTSNPIGVSAPYFRKQFVKARPKMEIAETDAIEGGFLRQYIPALVEDNPSENAERTKARVSGIGDQAIADALLNEDWDSPVGNFFKQYSSDVHEVPDFNPPDHWFKFITFDWGSAEPFAVLWWCVSDGQEFVDDGTVRWFPRGALVAYREWYGCADKRPAVGCEMRNPDIARGIVNRTHEDWSKLIVTDSLPFQDRGMEKNGKKYRIADVFAENGAPLILGNCARVTGWTQVRDRLIGINGFPLLYLTENCVYTRDYLPAIARSKTNPEDAEEDGEATHLCDCVRLACTTRPFVRDKSKTAAEARKDAVTPKRIIEQLRRNGYNRY